MVRTLVGLLCLFGLLHSAVGQDIHAVLIAGSNGYWNYRHQADVSHAYQILIGHGVKPDNIITMMYDDVANNWQNPFPGKLFNAPNGVDVYAGVKIDYKEEDVTPDNFLAVLRGDAKAVRGGNGRVLQSTKDDKVFVNFVDHGYIGLIAVMDDIVTVGDLNKTLQSMVDANKFQELVFYLEACESGSMFEDVLPAESNIYAITAANAHESSWACYCNDPNMDYTCLGDTFSVSWMEDSDAQDLNKESLQTQYEITRENTKQDSHVMQYGNLSIASEVVANFQGSKSPRALLRQNRHRPASSRSLGEQWPSRDVPLKTLEARAKHASDPAKRAQLQKELADMKIKRAYHDMHTRALVNKLVQKEKAQEVLTKKPTSVARVVDCHDQAVKAYHKSCFNLGRNPYAGTVSGALANLCEHVETQKLVETIKSHCEHKNPRMVNIH